MTFYWWQSLLIGFLSGLCTSALIDMIRYFRRRR